MRFKSEYFNTNYARNELKNIVNMIHYGELKIQDRDISFSFVCYNNLREVVVCNKKIIFVYEYC